MAAVRTSADEGGNWRRQAACTEVDPDLFFFESSGRTRGQQARAAQAVCMACPVLAVCREWALATRPEFGICGGMTPRERRVALARRREVAA